MTDLLDAKRKTYTISLLLFLIIAILQILLFYSCTISFHNISTHGSATDLIDENQKATDDISPTVSIPSI